MSHRDNLRKSANTHRLRVAQQERLRRERLKRENEFFIEAKERRIDIIGQADTVAGLLADAGVNKDLAVYKNTGLVETSGWFRKTHTPVKEKVSEGWSLERYDKWVFSNRPLARAWVGGGSPSRIYETRSGLYLSEDGDILTLDYRIDEAISRGQDPMYSPVHNYMKGKGVEQRQLCAEYLRQITLHPEMVSEFDLDPELRQQVIDEGLEDLLPSPTINEYLRDLYREQDLSVQTRLGQIVAFHELELPT